MLLSAALGLRMFAMDWRMHRLFLITPIRKNYSKLFVIIISIFGAWMHRCVLYLLCLGCR